MSAILPIDITLPPAATTRSSNVSPCGRRRVVLAVRRALEGVRGFADERPRDDAADIERLGQLLRDRTDGVEPLETEMRLVRGDLKHRVGRGVADRLAGADVLLAQLADDVGAGGVAIAEDAGQAAARDQRGDEIGREARPRAWEKSPGERHRQAGDFPMAARRVLADTALRGASIGAFDAAGRIEAGAMARPRRGRGARGSAGATARRANPRGRRGPRGTRARCDRAYRRRRRR